MGTDPHPPVSTSGFRFTRPFCGRSGGGEQTVGILGRLRIDSDTGTGEREVIA
jgi:hypothetical protein